jgi:hypothetical protein
MWDAAMSAAEPASDAAEFGSGTEYFQLEAFGLSALEVRGMPCCNWLVQLGYIGIVNICLSFGAVGGAE